MPHEYEMPQSSFSSGGRADSTSGKASNVVYQDMEYSGSGYELVENGGRHGRGVGTRDANCLYEETPPSAMVGCLSNVGVGGLLYCYCM